MAHEVDISCINMINACFKCRSFIHKDLKFENLETIE